MPEPVPKGRPPASPASATGSPAKSGEDEFVDFMDDLAGFIAPDTVRPTESRAVDATPQTAPAQRALVEKPLDRRPARTLVKPPPPFLASPRRDFAAAIPREDPPEASATQAPAREAEPPPRAETQTPEASARRASLPPVLSPAFASPQIDTAFPFRLAREKTPSPPPPPPSSGKLRAEVSDAQASSGTMVVEPSSEPRLKPPLRPRVVARLLVEPPPRRTGNSFALGAVMVLVLAVGAFAWWRAAPASFWRARDIALTAAAALRHRAPSPSTVVAAVAPPPATASILPVAIPPNAAPAQSEFVSAPTVARGSADAGAFRDASVGTPAPKSSRRHRLSPDDNPY